MVDLLYLFCLHHNNVAKIVNSELHIWEIHFLYVLQRILPH